jgi:hypothetical protein
MIAAFAFWAAADANGIVLTYCTTLMTLWIPELQILKLHRSKRPDDTEVGSDG